MAENTVQSPSRPRPALLLILDGWGIGPNNAGNAILRAKTPNMDKYWLAFPHTQLAASGKAVGLPHGEDGNTETGHLNIGAGRIVYQELPRINMAIADGTFATNQVFQNTFQHVKNNKSTLHLMGLIGSGGVHSNIEHLYALMFLAKSNGFIDNVYLHLFTDGRDSPPTSGLGYVREVMEKTKSLGVGKVASIIGRYYAMDRDHRWDRTQIAYDALTIGAEQQCVLDPLGLINEGYKAGITDEFIKPISICEADGKPRLINDNDAVIFFNYRIDRPRQLTKAFIIPDFETGIRTEGYDPYAIKYEKSHISYRSPGKTFFRKKKLGNLFFTTMTRYEIGLPTNVAFPPQNIEDPIGKILSDAGLKQLRMAETEKERFVTYYMNGQRDDTYPGEDRIIVPSKKIATYDLAPEMSAYEITETMIQHIQRGTYDVIICNFANADMVAHTGNLGATIKACEVIDECVGMIAKEIVPKGGVILITADHGNAEELINNESGEVDTEHSIYPVPFIAMSNAYMGQSTLLPTGILADVAPTLLKILGVPKPASMTGRELV
ncbi:MAG: 2,3-bisphosphoglycerate-independent phosphoglycerate mutase [Patescibacteria group bacterium]